MAFLSSIVKERTVSKGILLFVFCCVVILFTESCKSKQELVETSEPTKEVYLNTIEVSPKEESVYRASRSRINDLIHTKLEVSFGWDSSYLYGKANLLFKPYFYPTSELILDAKGFQIHEVAMVDEIGSKNKLAYTYDSSQLKIDLGKVYHRTDTYEVFIDYTAMPNKLENKGSSAISDEKGLFFINPDESEKGKPRQVWTQGEPESSSCWFPTIDSPNERTTQEIYITVEKGFKTLSNGELMFQIENGDGTRTDYWEQNKPHAPYLFMLAAGDFAEVEDSWRDIPVHYFVEPKYEDIAKDIYPNTVEMLEFFSTVLDYDYPWDKFHQIVVRDYVSGAMENSGAVVYGDFIQGDKRFLIDNSGEDIVAHEMFHHWFGNLVTCESWSNLPLNEAFATYGEYLWFEHKYGRDQADYHAFNDRRRYFESANISKKRIIRYDYEKKTDMFDAHTYQKGGLVLHMLRSYVGDEAFFAALNYYLKENAYQSVEIHHLRLAFEKITGEDLNWFFNQWFLSSGHPEIEVNKKYVDSTNTLTITIEQLQSGNDVPEVFKLPTNIEIIDAYGNVEVKEIIIDKRVNTFEYQYDKAPVLVNLDKDKNLYLATIKHNYNKEEIVALYANKGSYLNRYAAIEYANFHGDTLFNSLKKEALKDEFWHIRQMAIEGIEPLIKMEAEETHQQLLKMVVEDESSDVRAVAIEALLEHYKDDTPISVFRQATNDSSYYVVAYAIEALYEKDSIEGLKVAKTLEDIESPDVYLEIAYIYIADGSIEHFPFFKSKMKGISGMNSYYLSSLFGDYLEGQPVDIVEEGLPLLKEAAVRKSDVWWMRMNALGSIVQLKNRFEGEMNAQEKLMNLENPDKTPAEVMEKYNKSKEVHDKIQLILKEIEETEGSENLLRILEYSLGYD